MERYLFADGTNVVREARTKEELESLITASNDLSKARVWIFNTNEWISIAEFRKRAGRSQPVTVSEPDRVQPVKPARPRQARVIPSVLKNLAFGIVLITTVLLIYNFSRVSWSKADPLKAYSQRPSNTPVVNMDSLVQTIEILRGQKLDKVTKTNLRIRNNWPDLLQLSVKAERDISRDGSRFYNLQLVFDNSTGYRVDNARVKLAIWKNDKLSEEQEIEFNGVNYTEPVSKQVEGMFRGDSISVSFSSIRAKAFNFCYSASRESNYGNYNDRWFCR